jgi:demethylmenaquinone methyltransferase/2-methoxy-6-polyprenyl-1,4-benzoquinol methylase
MSCSLQEFDQSQLHFCAMSTAIQSMFDAIAGRYDTLNRVLSAGRDLVWRRKAVQLLPPSVMRAEARVLDLCGGTGDFAAALRRAGSGAACVVGDFSRPMLALSVPKNLGTAAVVLDALHPPLKAGSLDAVLCGFGMRNLDDTEAGIRTVHGLLKPGGTFVTLEFFRPAGWFARFFYGVAAPLFIPLFGWALGSRRTAYTYLVDSVRRFRTATEYAAMCRAAGFGTTRVVALDFGIAHIVSAEKPALR